MTETPAAPPSRASSPCGCRASSRSPSGRTSSSGRGSVPSSGRTGRARATSPTRCAGRSASRAGRSARARPRTSSGRARTSGRPRAWPTSRSSSTTPTACCPVDFGVLELGRRLYRSGENDYLLNKSRIRLRDLVDLLDAAHLADNAFLFIGQGMVDQALALRPEERRPLFEEVAGVRRHERRRRRAEEQLVESEANLARVEDILGELRPQARRLAAQAEQQAIARDDGRGAGRGAPAGDARSLARGGRPPGSRRGGSGRRADRGRWRDDGAGGRRVGRVGPVRRSSGRARPIGARATRSPRRRARGSDRGPAAGRATDIGARGARARSAPPPRRAIGGRGRD